MPRTTDQKLLAAADAQVDDAKSRLNGLLVERRALEQEIEVVEEANRRALYDQAAADGTTADVTAGRAQADRLRQQLADLEHVQAALEDGVTKAEQERERIIFASWPSLADALEERARVVVRERAALHERHSAELAAQKRAEHGLLDQWRSLVDCLPTIFKPRISTASLEPERRPDTADNEGLSAFVTDPSWPAWAAEALTRARRAEQARRDRDVVNIPVS